MELQQLRAGQIEIGDYLPNLGEVTRIHCADWGIRFTFKDSATRQFSVDAICYVTEGERKRRKKWKGEDGKPVPRERATTRKGVSVE